LEIVPKEKLFSIGIAGEWKLGVSGNHRSFWGREFA
jgi:hypothetical protein